LDDGLARPRLRRLHRALRQRRANSLHAEPTIAAAEAGKHVLCEKPLGRNAEESYELWQRVSATGVKHMCAFNYRFVPAVRLARELADAGEIGDLLMQWELNGTKGSIAFDMERLNELQVFRAGSGPARGFETVLVTEPEHPFLEWWWPPGHILGWEHTFVHEIHHLLRAIAENTDVAPLGATFENGYRAAEVCDAIVRSAETWRREDIVYR
jgi:predicted dehydrogenase